MSDIDSQIMRANDFSNRCGKELIQRYSDHSVAVGYKIEDGTISNFLP
ncbi:MAG TPA: hypothetical protein VFD60_07260 [Nitrososphaeraceae archaeon]|jgi:hypothetical protein|nr:hypothetical protein [Nitrososphaeraceae archaeon]